MYTLCERAREGAEGLFDAGFSSFVLASGGGTQRRWSRLRLSRFRLLRARSWRCIWGRAPSQSDALSVRNWKERHKSGTTFTHCSYKYNQKCIYFACTYCGWSLYRVPSTPTVTSRWSRPRFSRILSTTAAIPAPQIWAARWETAPHTSLTIILSSHVLSRPRCCRMDLTCSSAKRSLEGRNNH